MGVAGIKLWWTSLLFSCFSHLDGKRNNAYFWLATRVLEHRKKKLFSKLLQWHNTNTRIKIPLTLSKFLKFSDSVSLPGKLGIIKSASKEELSRVFSNTTVRKHQFFSAQLSSQSNSHIHTWWKETRHILKKSEQYYGRKYHVSSIFHLDDRIFSI